VAPQAVNRGLGYEMEPEEGRNRYPVVAVSRVEHQITSSFET
jgi:hypothetical protein